MHKKEYEDIIGLPHHVSTVHPQMSIYDRAAQFSPFAALTGHEAAIQETARLTEEQAELNEDKKEELNSEVFEKLLQKLQELMAHAEEHPTVTVTYFKPDDRKEGGKYETVTGTFRKIRDYDKMFILEDGMGIACDMIYELEVNGFWK